MSKTKTTMLTTMLTILLAALALLPASAGRAANVVATIAPVHSLVQGVVGESGDVHLLLPASQSPHGAHLKPSQVKALNDADVVFYIDDMFETFLKKAFKALPEPTHRVALFNEADSGSDDLHIWLDPQIASRLVDIIARHMAEVSPQNRALYETNARALASRITALDEDLRKRLEPVRGKPFAVFHDAYRRFTDRYGLSIVAVVSPGAHDHHHHAPTIPRIREAGEAIRSAGAVCVFHEPQFSARAVNTLSEDLNIKSGALDPLGAGLETGANLYFNLLENLATNIHSCLSA